LPLYAFGVFWLLTATMAVDHFELFGIKQSTGIDVMAKVGLGTNGFS